LSNWGGGREGEKTEFEGGHMGGETNSGSEGGGNWGHLTAVIARKRTEVYPKKKKKSRRKGEVT